MKTRFVLPLCCALSALLVLPAAATGDASSVPPTAPAVDSGSFGLVDVLAMLLAAAILCGIIFLFYRVLRPRSQGEKQSRRLKRR